MPDMITADHDGLSAVQIKRINRLELARYRKSRQRAADAPLIGLLIGILLLIYGTIRLMHFHWSPGNELWTRLPNLNEQTPSITIYAKP